MKMELERLVFQNFKGIKSLTVKFNRGSITNVFGANRSGKTTLFDGFCWLLTEKDSLDRKQFEIKTLDSTNKYAHKQPHSVEGVFYQDTFKTVLKREYVEKWQKKRGEEQDTFTGHETNHFVDGVPVTKKEYQDVIDKIIPENILKLITNPFYFPSLKWEEKRKLVLNIAGEPSLKDVAAGVKRLESLLQVIDGKELEMWRKKIKADKAEIKKRKDVIPPAIDELNLLLPEEYKRFQHVDELMLINDEIKTINKKIDDRKANVGKKAQQHEQLSADLIVLNNQLANEKAKALAEFDEANDKKISLLDSERQELAANIRMIRAFKSGIEELGIEYGTLSRQRKSLLDDYNHWNSMSFTVKETDTTCYACGQALPDAVITIETRKEVFIKDQKENLDRIKKVGESVKTKIKIVDEEIEKLKAEIAKHDEVDINLEIANINDEIRRLRISYPSNKAESVLLLEEKVEVKKKEIDSITIKEVDVSDLTQRIAELVVSQKEIEKAIILEDEAVKTKQRINKLIVEESQLASEIAKLEKLEFDGDLLVKRKIEMMEGAIAAKFNGVQFKMYNQLINGGEEATCEILIDGVPFDNANHAAQINTGIKIINCLSSYYERHAPIFIDNAEAVNELTSTSSQLIRLVVVEPGFTTDNGIILNPLK